MAHQLPKSIREYSEANPFFPPARMVSFQDGRNAGLEEAAALVAETINELSELFSDPDAYSGLGNNSRLAGLANKIRGLHFVHDRDVEQDDALSDFMRLDDSGSE